MKIALNEEHEALRAELRDYFSQLVTPDVRAGLSVAKLMPSGLSSERAAAFSPFTNSRSTRCSSLTTRIRLTGLVKDAPL